jgi:dTDP-4-dehydrorhamnose reductase
LKRDADGILHCCGGEHACRVELARRAVEAFELDGDLLDVGPPDAAALPPGGAPFDTRLDAAATARILDTELPGLDTMLGRLRTQMESHCLTT